ncbi:unnamed protein product [Rhizoctonia solani]|uniref:T6SS Phospholipase effector Tle1-like catalytic domain-containing protein n=1 Tax=Rhizoctonia solani TaxID=456999 RepID=A0A8H3BLL6_9AGAM|nr:unnamed protein product [Rhizoctonia solani]
MAESIDSRHLKRKRISLYIPGVGSGKGDLKIKRWLIQIYGSRIGSLFGYSRGAFAARKLASLLLRLELTNTGRSFLEKWRLCERPLSWIPSEEPPKTPIAVECIGVWDTVGAVYNPVFRLKQNIIGTPDDEQVTPGIKFKPSH